MQDFFVVDTLGFIMNFCGFNLVTEIQELLYDYILLKNLIWQFYYLMSFCCPVKHFWITMDHIDIINTSWFHQI